VIYCSVPQGSVLGSIEFISYTEEVVVVFHSNLVHHHLFADDMQLYSATSIADIDATLQVSCILDKRDWCASRWQQLNAGKIELVWYGSAANLLKISTTNLTLSVVDDVITLVDVVRDVGVHLDAELIMKQHVNHVICSRLKG